jgi:hypothetical protein
VLQMHPIVQHPMQMAEMQSASGPHSRHNALV